MNSLSSHIGALELNHLAAGFDDGALEAMSHAMAPPTSFNHPGVPCANADGALEAVGRQVESGPTRQLYPHCISDGVLEAAVSLTANPATAHWRPGLIPCMNDGALEAAVQAVAQSPTHRFPAGPC